MIRKKKNNFFSNNCFSRKRFDDSNSVQSIVLRPPAGSRFSERRSVTNSLLQHESCVTILARVPHVEDIIHRESGVASENLNTARTRRDFPAQKSLDLGCLLHRKHRKIQCIKLRIIYKFSFKYFCLLIYFIFIYEKYAVALQTGVRFFENIIE